MIKIYAPNRLVLNQPAIFLTPKLLITSLHKWAGNCIYLLPTTSVVTLVAVGHASSDKEIELRAIFCPGEKSDFYLKFIGLGGSRRNTKVRSGNPILPGVPDESP